MRVKLNDGHQVRAELLNYSATQRRVHRGDEAVRALVAGEAEVHAVHRVAEGESCFAVGEAEGAAGAGVAEAGGAG